MSKASELARQAEEAESAHRAAQLARGGRRRQPPAQGAPRTDEATTRITRLLTPEDRAREAFPESEERAARCATAIRAAIREELAMRSEVIASDVITRPVSGSVRQAPEAPQEPTPSATARVQAERAAWQAKLREALGPVVELAAKATKGPWSACVFPDAEHRFPHLHLEAIDPKSCEKERGLPTYIVFNESASIDQCRADALLTAAMKRALPRLTALLAAEEA